MPSAQVDLSQGPMYKSTSPGVRSTHTLQSCCVNIPSMPANRFEGGRGNGTFTHQILFPASVLTFFGDPMQIKSSYFKLTIPVEVNEMRDVLEKEFPEYQFTVYGSIGKGIMIGVKDSGMTGARIVKAAGTYRIIPKPVSFLGRLIFAFTRFNTPTSYKICNRVHTFLTERFN